MFRQTYLPVLTLCLWALFSYAPAAQAQEVTCACECVAGVEGAPPTTTWACNTFITLSQPAEGCPVETYCPAEPAPAPSEPVVPEEPVVVPEEPVVSGETDVPTTPVADNTEAEPPVSGLQCRYRKVYRPDQGKFKKIKVCKLSKEERTARRAERRERIAAFQDEHSDAIARLRAKHQASIAEWRSNHRRGRGGN